MDSDAAAGEGAIHQRLGGRPRPLQRAGAHVNRLRRRASRLQQAELAIVLAFLTPFVNHGGIAMAGELAVMGGPLGPRSAGGGLDGFPVAGRRRADTVAAELDHFLQLPVRGGSRLQRQQRQRAGDKQA